jgi:hypothetical protein
VNHCESCKWFQRHDYDQERFALLAPESLANLKQWGTCTLLSSEERQQRLVELRGDLYGGPVEVDVHETFGCVLHAPRDAA